MKLADSFACAARAYTGLWPIQVLGIDLGTTNSAVAECASTGPDHPLPRAECIEVVQETPSGTHISALVPSVVALHERRVHVGEGARQLRFTVADRIRKNRHLFFECKNEIGTAMTYPNAPVGFRSPQEIASRVLSVLYDAAIAAGPTPQRAVVTVPASFQNEQRRHTVDAARMAGIPLTQDELLDEPIAAVIDYLYQHGLDPGSYTGKWLVVFDIGGGTSDVAVFRGVPPAPGSRLGLAVRAVSRYHRVGGGDIDRAIVHECLIPQLQKQNNLTRFDLDFEDRKGTLEPMLLGAAESLKIMLCGEISRLSGFGLTADEDLQVQLPYTMDAVVRGRSLPLTRPTLSAQEFDGLVQPFLDEENLFARHTDYRMTCSVFAPLRDALDRAQINPRDVDICLLVGGCSLVPQISQAIDLYLTRAELWLYPDRESYQTCVARGAAYHALALALTNRGLVEPVCQDDLFLRTVSEPLRLVPRGHPLPFPRDSDFEETDLLIAPEDDNGQPVDVRIEIVAGSEDSRVIDVARWPKVPSGAPITVRYRYGADQVLRLSARAGISDRDLQLVIESPLTNVVNPGKTRMEIEELEIAIRAKEYPRPVLPPVYCRMAELYASLGQHERALGLIFKAQQIRGQPDAAILSQKAAYASALGNHELSDKAYQDAAVLCGWSGAWFNLALSKRNRGEYAEAAEILDRALAQDRSPAYLVLKGLLLRALGQEPGEVLAEALRLFGPVSTLTDFELGWLHTGAGAAGDERLVSAADSEIQKRTAREVYAETTGFLPLRREESI